MDMGMHGAGGWNCADAQRAGAPGRSPPSRCPSPSSLQYTTVLTAGI